MEKGDFSLSIVLYLLKAPLLWRDVFIFPLKNRMHILITSDWFINISRVAETVVLTGTINLLTSPRIINHFDLVAAEKTGIENELIKRWGTAPDVKKYLSENRRNIYIRNYMNSIHMCPPYVAKTTDVFNFLVAKHAI